MPPSLTIQTGRLRILPLSQSQLKMYTEPDHALERALNLDLFPRNVPEELKEAFERLILPNTADNSRNFLFSTVWTIIDKQQNRMVGDLCFKGEPNEQGEVEIGYGTYPDCQNRGYMTEAVGALSAWALQQPGVVAVLAETDNENVPSHRTLENNGYRPFHRNSNMTWWRLDRPSI
jgi:[ribosomal protein S5]-alanine N-acetyltransferase